MVVGYWVAGGCCEVEADEAALQDAISINFLVKFDTPGFRVCDGSVSIVFGDEVGEGSFEGAYSLAGEFWEPVDDGGWSHLGCEEGRDDEPGGDVEGVWLR